jgi:DNA-binding transcriptional LysR family regulator
MDPVETRVLVAYVAVAEELHFGRAAERLGISQPGLSRTIAALERRVGLPLLLRTSRRVELTPSGAAFLDGARRTLDAAEGAVARARAAHRPAPLRLATRPGTAPALLGRLLATYECSAPIELVFARDQASAVRRGAADVAVVCATDGLTGLATVELGSEEAYAVMPATHRLAGRSVVHTAELQTDPLFVADCPHDLDELLDLVSLGRLVTVVGHSAVERLGSRGAAAPVADQPPTELLLAWREDDTDLRIARLLDTAETLSPRR